MLKLPDKEISLWEESSENTNYPELKEDLEVDVAIVGGGISGINTGYLMKKAGFSVAIVERGKIARGTSGNTTGKVTSQHGLIYANLNESLGENTAKLYGEANQEAIKHIEALIKNEKINCGWKRSDNFVYTRDSIQVKTYQNEVKIAQKLGLPATFETKTSLPFNIKGAVRFSDQAQFNAKQYCVSLASKINSSGSYVFENTRALGIRDGAPAKVRTKHGTISAKNIIVATNVPSPPLVARFGYCVLEYPQTSYIVAARTEFKLDGMYISTDKNEYSILPINSGQDNILLIGGESHIRDMKFNKKTRCQRLSNYAEERFSANSIDYRWSAWDYIAYDNVPLVGKIYPWSKHLYVISAFRKWGLTNSMVSAMILRDVITGEKNNWSDIYNPIRTSPIKSIPSVAKKYIVG
jgi:glycine/D-amino acid oxidase-like deaminating enzyme